MAASPLFFSTALVATPLLRVVLDLELCSPAMATTDEEEALMRRKGRVIFGQVVPLFIT